MGEPEDEILIPADPDTRRRLADFAGLTAEERSALDQWVYLQAQERRQGVVSAEEAGRQ